MERTSIVLLALLWPFIPSSSLSAQPVTQPAGSSAVTANDVQPILNAINLHHDNFLKNYRAVVLTVTTNSLLRADALDIIWRDGDKAREDHHLPGVETKSSAHPLPKFFTPETLLAWAAQDAPAAKLMVDGRREYVWFAGNAKAPRPRVQVVPFHDFPHIVSENSWPDDIQWPTRRYSPADFHILDANAETPAGCVGLRFGGDGNNRTDFYIDPAHDFICTKHIEWIKRAGRWTKNRVFTISSFRRIDGHFLAETQRVRTYMYNDAEPSALPEIANQVTTIDIIPAAPADYPPGVFDSASLTTGADPMGN